MCPAFEKTAMTDPESLLIADYYERRLAFWEDLDPAVIPGGQLESEAAEASSLRKLLGDYREEDLHEMIDWIVGRTDAEARLERFLGRALGHLGPPGERERFYLYPEEVAAPKFERNGFAGGKEWELEDYLEHLERVDADRCNVESAFPDAATAARWRSKTKALMGDMVGYLFQLAVRIERMPRLQPVVLLRDTLVIQLGLGRLRAAGWRLPEPKAIVFNRAFANAFGPPESIYETLLVEGLCRVVHEERPLDLQALRTGFTRRALKELEIPESFVRASRQKLAELEIEGVPVFVESGVNGTFPLWLLALNGGEGEMTLYSTAPWLYEIYAPVVFRKNYNYLREMETLVAHEHLFQIVEGTGEEVSGGWRVAETTDPVARELAYCEVAIFLQLVDERLSGL